MGLDLEQWQSLRSFRKQNDKVFATLSLSAYIKLLFATFCERDFEDNRGTEGPLDKTNGHMCSSLILFLQWFIRVK